MTAHSSHAVANKLLEIARNRGKSLTPMQVLKLVYLCHGWMLGLCGLPLIRDRVEAWKYGPVIPGLYHSLKKYGADPVTETIEQPYDTPFDDQEDGIIEEVFDVYGNHTGPQLSTITHRPGSPWSQTWDAGGTVIPNDGMKRHYKELARNDGTA